MGSSKKKSKTTNSVPDWVESGAQQALSTARGFANRPYTPYQGERVAGLTANEQQGVGLARTAAGQWAGDIDTARGLLGRTTERFTDADINAYMNPYIESALDPAARQIRENAAMQRNQLTSQQASRGAFGGGRTAALEQGLTEATGQNVGDLYKTGMFEAFERGADRWSADRDAARQAAGDYQNLAATQMNLSTQDIQNLMSTGAVQRGVEQMKNDFNYQQFIEERDWDVKGLDALLATLQGIQGSYTTTSTRTDENKPSALGQAIGIASTIYGASTGGLFTGAMEMAKGMFGGGTQPAPGYGMPGASQSAYGGTTYTPSPWMTQSASNAGWAGMPPTAPTADPRFGDTSSWGYGGG